MTRIILALLMVLLLASPVRSDIQESILPLVDASTGRIICTTFSINAHRGLYVTARHCVFMGDGSFAQVTIKDHEVTLVKDFPRWDIAILKGPVGSPALPLADAPLIEGDEVSTAGYPGGSTQMVIGAGKVVDPDAYVFDEDMEGLRSILTIRVVRGQSGSPIMDAKGRVVGVLQFFVAHEPRHPSAASGGSRYGDLRRAAGSYWED